MKKMYFFLVYCVSVTFVKENEKEKKRTKKKVEINIIAYMQLYSLLLHKINSNDVDGQGRLTFYSKAIILTVVSSICLLYTSPSPRDRG